jgi:hypothetical protein
MLKVVHYNSLSCRIFCRDGQIARRKCPDRLIDIVPQGRTDLLGMLSLGTGVIRKIIEQDTTE